MTIRTKALIIIGASLLCMAGLVYVTSRFTFMKGLEEIEERQTSESVQRVLAALSYVISDLEADTADWAAWDDTYAFIEDGNNEYIETNLVDETFLTLKLNLMLFVHSSGQVVFGKAFDIEDEEEIPIPQDLLRHLSDNTTILSQAGTHNFISGIILLRQGPVIIASQPILTSEDKGPARGTLILARYFDSEAINDLAQLVLFPVTMRPINNLAYPDFREAFGLLSQEDPIVVKPMNTQYISGYAVINDVYEKPALVLRVDVPRDAYQLGQVTTIYYVLTLLGSGVLVASAAMFVIQRQILARFNSLIRGISHITTSGDTSTRVSVGGRDELSLVAGTINGMLATLQEAETEIRESEERYRDLFENATDLIQSVTADGHFLYVNEAWRNTLGYSEEEVADLSLWDIIHTDSRTNFRKVLQKVMAGEPVDNIEVTFMTNGGKSIIVEGNVNARSKEGEPVSIRGIFHDITERKQVQERLQVLYERERDMRKELETEISKRTEFTRALVHELKTPITPVLAATELLLEAVKDESSIRLVQSIDRSASNLNRRIDDLMDLIKGETDMLELSFNPVDLVQLLEDIGSEMTPVASSKGHSLTVELSSSHPVVWADGDRVRQIVLNLLDNAFKFTPEGGKITLRAKEEGANLVVEIHDTGPGMNKEDQQRVFNPYYRRVEDRERLSGLGLGLALSKRLVELHGGRIWVKSRKGKGATFGFSLPLETASRKEG